VSVAVTFCAQTKRERCDNESGDSLFRWSEAESLPHFIEPEAQGLFQLAKVFRFNSEIDPCAAAEPEPSADNATIKGPRQSMDRDSRYGVSRKFSGPQRTSLPVGGKRINFLCKFIEANRGRSGRITQGDVRFGDLANILGRVRE